MKLLTNHLGYGCMESKQAVYQGAAGDAAAAFRVLDQKGNAVYEGSAVARGTVSRWGAYTEEDYYWTLDFSNLTEPGRYCIALHTERGETRSAFFEIAGALHKMRLISALGYYFKAQRASGEWQAADRRLSFQGGHRKGWVDAHGGWYDATGDYGMHMSHLSHSGVFNPQQTPLSVWAFFRAVENLDESGSPQYSMLRRRLLDEGLFGADFLMRMVAPSGGFFRSVERLDSFGDPALTRVIGLEYRGSSDQFGEAVTAAAETISDENYETSLRSGGGMCIAALAEAATCDYPFGEYPREQYLRSAEMAWEYLARNNTRYTNDGEWNLIDEYCALIALCALIRATGRELYHRQAAEIAERILRRVVEPGQASAGEPVCTRDLEMNPTGTSSPILEEAADPEYFEEEDTSELQLLDGIEGEPHGESRIAYLEVRPGEPYHHPSDEGLPVLALLEYVDLAMDRGAAEKALNTCECLMRGMLELSAGIANPFDYPRFRYREGEGIQTGFFFPHHTSAAPWWQGENARLASLAAAARRVAACTADSALAARLKCFADRQMDWLLGCNPFDASMVEGFGHGHISYFFNGRYDFLNCPGGVVNGITSAPNDAEGIAFFTEPTAEITDNWRWAEQWLPHVSWLLYAQSLRPE